MSHKPNKFIVMDEPIHEAFGLTYASYFVAPRSLLQSMPPGWQKRFVDLINEMNDHFGDWEQQEYRVLATEGGRFVSDPWRDYDRGRRVVTPIEVQGTATAFKEFRHLPRIRTKKGKHGGYVFVGPDAKKIEKEIRKLLKEEA